MFEIFAKAKRIALWTSITLAVLWLLSYHSQWKIKRAIRNMEGRCLKEQDTIFVGVICRATYTASLLFDLYERSSCPKRINVSVYEINDGTTNSLDMYRDKVKNADAGLSYEKQVHIMKRELSDTGLYGALRELMTHGHTNEKFICTISECFVAEEMWDKRYIEGLEPMSCLVMGSGYPYISTFEQEFPVFEYKESAATASRFWTMNASFSPSQFWDALTEHHEFAGRATEFLISCEAIAKGWKFKHIPVKFDKTLRIPWGLPKLKPKEFRQKYKKVLESMQVLPSLSKDALLGVVNGSDEEEINSKYGSRSEYVYALSKV
jgi:hypothetical protein